jgi:hypothetical protein
LKEWSNSPVAKDHPGIVGVYEKYFGGGTQVPAYDPLAFATDVGAVFGAPDPEKANVGGHKFIDMTPEEAKANLEQFIAEKTSESPGYQKVYDKYFGGKPAPSQEPGGSESMKFVNELKGPLSFLADEFGGLTPAEQQAHLKYLIDTPGQLGTQNKPVAQELYEKYFGKPMTPAAEQTGTVFSPAALAFVIHHLWPGNKNVGQNIMKMTDEDEIRTKIKNTIHAFSKSTGLDDESQKSLENWKTIYNHFWGGEEAAPQAVHQPSLGEQLKALKPDMLPTAEYLDAKLKGKTPAEIKHLLDNTVKANPDIADKLQQWYIQNYGGKTQPGFQAWLAKSHPGYGTYKPPFEKAPADEQLKLLDHWNKFTDKYKAQWAKKEQTQTPAAPPQSISLPPGLTGQGTLPGMPQPHVAPDGSKGGKPTPVGELPYGFEGYSIQDYWYKPGFQKWWQSLTSADQGDILNNPSVFSDVYKLHPPVGSDKFIWSDESDLAPDEYVPGMEPEHKGKGKGKYYDLSPFGLVPKTKEKQGLPGIGYDWSPYAHNPQPSTSTGRPVIKFPRKPDLGQETIPLPKGEHWAPNYAPLPVYRALSLDLNWFDTRRQNAQARDPAPQGADGSDPPDCAGHPGRSEQLVHRLQARLCPRCTSQTLRR